MALSNSRCRLPGRSPIAMCSHRANNRKRSVGRRGSQRLEDVSAASDNLHLLCVWLDAEFSKLASSHRKLLLLRCKAQACSTHFRMRFLIHQLAVEMPYKLTKSNCRFFSSSSLHLLSVVRSPYESYGTVETPQSSSFPKPFAAGNPTLEFYWRELSGWESSHELLSACRQHVVNLAVSRSRQ